MTINKDENVGLAFGLVIGAGLATALGAAVVFFPSLIHLASRRTLAGALGFSAGVMTYVSFVEILMKSVQSFKDADFLDKQAYLSATMCFFAGIIIMQVSLVWAFRSYEFVCSVALYCTVMTSMIGK